MRCQLGTNLRHSPGIIERLIAAGIPTWFRRVRLLALPALLVVASGCGGGPDYHLVPVEGTLLYRDKPVKMAAIQLVPDEANASNRPSAAGQTDADGHFMLTSPPHGPGVAPGAYRAFVVAYGASTFPQRYSNPKTGLVVIVPEQGSPDLVLTMHD